MNNSRVTSFSFTVDDDLISQTSANTNFIQPKPFSNFKPFSKDFGPRGAAGVNHFQQAPLAAYERKVKQRAQNDAYKDMNNDLFNPFEHKLESGYLGKQIDLYQRERQKQIQQIKRKEEQQFSKASNYTIVFNNNQQSRSLKVAAKQILGQENVNASISDHYNKKFKKKKDVLNEIVEENQDNEAIKNNFIGDRTEKKKEKQPLIPKRQINSQKNMKPKIQNMNNNKIVKSKNGWKAQSSKEIENKQQQVPPLQEKQSYSDSYIPRAPVKPKVETRPTKHNKIIPKNNEIMKKKQPSKVSNQKTPTLNKQQKKLVPDGGKKKYSEVYEGADRHLIEQLQNEITESPNITFDDIAELQTAKGLLQQAVLLPRMMPQFFKGIRRAMKGVLLFGPPGTGKTLLAKAIANGNMFFNVSASSLASKWKGQSEKMVRLLFEMARYYSPSIEFFDQIDAIATKRSENENESTRKVKTQLLVQMDGVGNNEQQVFVLAATNRPWDLDEALRRRLQKRIYIPLPGKQGRQKMFEINLKDLKVSKEVSWAKLVQITKGCSGSDICNICRDAAYMPMRKKLSQIGGINKISQISKKDLLDQEITDAYLIESAKKIRPSVGNEDLKRYSQWMKEFGST